MSAELLALVATLARAATPPDAPRVNKHGAWPGFRRAHASAHLNASLLAFGKTLQPLGCTARVLALLWRAFERGVAPARVGPADVDAARLALEFCARCSALVTDAAPTLARFPLRAHGNFGEGWAVRGVSALTDVVNAVPHTRMALAAPTLDAARRIDVDDDGGPLAAALGAQMALLDVVTVARELVEWHQAHASALPRLAPAWVRDAVGNAALEALYVFGREVFPDGATRAPLRVLTGGRAG